MYVTLQVKSVMMIFLTHVNHRPLIAFTITLVSDLFVITLILTLKIDLNHALADVANHVTKMMNRTNPLTLTQTTVVAAVPFTISIVFTNKRTNYSTRFQT